MSALDTTPYWDSTSSMPRHPALDRDLTVDVAIIGAGITGLTAAYLLKRSGLTVAVLDRNRAGGIDSGVTTAHVTCVTDLDLLDMAKNFGREQARAVWDAGMAAVEQIDTIVSDEAIACEWQRVPGYRHAPRGAADTNESARLEREAALARELGFDATFMSSVPFINTPGYEVAHQAKFHPRQYLAGLARLVEGDGSFIFEHTESGEVSDDPLRVEANGHTITCTQLVIATHTPLMGKAGLLSALALQTKLYLYTSYVVGGRLPEGSVPEALFWDTEDPYHYLRVDRHRGFDYVIFGGKDHKTGQTADPAGCFAALEATARALMPSLEVTHHWSGQVIETNDGLPFIGETAPHQFASTGYGGNGMTFGTLSGMMARDYVLGRGNPWQSLFDVGRTKLLRRDVGLPQRERRLPLLSAARLDCRPARQVTAGPEARARGAFSSSMGRRSPPIVTIAARFRCYRPPARIWAAACTGMAPMAIGSAPATVRDSRQPARCWRVRPSHRSSRSSQRGEAQAHFAAQPPAGSVVKRESANAASGVPSSRTAQAAIWPTIGPILKPWPDPPPTIQIRWSSGCRSMMKCESGVASY